MTAQRTSMDVIAQNIANAETTTTIEGGPYQRRIAELEAVLPGSTKQALARAGLPGNEDSAVVGGVRVAGIRTDATPGTLIYDPGNPAADKTGYVRMPNVNVIEELMAFNEAGDAVQANTTVFRALSSMLHRAAKI